MHYYLTEIISICKFSELHKFVLCEVLCEVLIKQHLIKNPIFFFLLFNGCFGEQV